MKQVPNERRTNLCGTNFNRRAPKRPQLHRCQPARTGPEETPASVQSLPAVPVKLKVQSLDFRQQNRTIRNWERHGARLVSVGNPLQLKLYLATQLGRKCTVMRLNFFFPESESVFVCYRTRALHFKKRKGRHINTCN